MSGLSALVTLDLDRVQYQAASMACLSVLTTLRRLEITDATSLPPTLPAMTWLECVNMGLADGVSVAEQEAWLQTESTTLPRLTCLTALALNLCGAVPLGVAQLPQLQRLWLWSSGPEPLPNPAALEGPWLASLRWLGLQWRMFERAVALLHAAPRLEYLCSVNTPVCTDEARWHTAWKFLATHPPLRYFGFEFESQYTANVPVEPLLDALVCLHARRPALQTRRVSNPDNSFPHTLSVLDPAQTLSPLPAPFA